MRGATSVGPLGDLPRSDHALEHGGEPIGPGRVGNVQRIDRVAGGVDDVGVDRAGGEPGVERLAVDAAILRLLLLGRRTVVSDNPR